MAALLFQILDYIQLELVEVPDDLTCTQLLQQWHVPRSDETDKPVLFEDLHFEKASYEKDVNGTKYLERVAVDYNPTPHFARISSQSKIERLAQELEEANKANYLNDINVQALYCQFTVICNSYSPLKVFVLIRCAVLYQLLSFRSE